MVKKLFVQKYAKIMPNLTNMPNQKYLCQPPPKYKICQLANTARIKICQLATLLAWTTDNALWVDVQTWF